MNRLNPSVLTLGCPLIKINSKLRQCKHLVVVKFSVLEEVIITHHALLSATHRGFSTIPCGVRSWFSFHVRMTSNLCSHSARVKPTRHVRTTTSNARGPSESGRGSPNMLSGPHMCRVGTQIRCHACMEREPGTNPTGDSTKSMMRSREQHTACNDHFF